MDQRLRLNVEQRKEDSGKDNNCSLFRRHRHARRVVLSLSVPSVCVMTLVVGVYTHLAWNLEDRDLDDRVQLEQGLYQAILASKLVKKD